MELKAVHGLYRTLQRKGQEVSSGAHLVLSLVCLEMLSSQNSLSSYYLDIFSMDSRIQAENKVALSSVLWP